MKLPKYSIDNFQFTLLFFLIMTILGVSSYLNMPRMENPEMSIPGGSIVAIYPGANSLDMEQLVALPIEEAINELEDIKRIETRLGDGIAVMSVEFEFATDAAEKYDELVQKVNTVQPDLPEDLMSINTLRWKSSDVATLQLALVSEDATYREMEIKAENLKDDLNKIRGIRKVEIHACPEQEIRVSLDLEKMAQMNISINQVSNAIKSNNANIPGGSINFSGRSFGIQTSGSYQNLKEIEKTVVNSYMGRLIYIKDIAKVSFDYKDNNYKARYNQQRAIFITVMQKEGLNIFKLHDKIRPVLNEFKENLDGDENLYYVFNQSDEVDQKINGFISNLLQGIVLVGFVILFALGFKSALIVIIAIPLSNLIGLAIIDFADFGLQQISIAGLVVALGLLVDNSIVVVENINRFIRLGKSPYKAAIEGTKEIGWPVVSATVTTLLAFVPIITMPDKAGKFIRSMPATIFATLTVSLIIALTLTPLIASKLLKPAKAKIRNTSVFSDLMQKFIEGPYRRTLGFALKSRGTIIIFSIFVFLGSVYLFKYVGISFFPKSEKPQFVIRIYTPEGSNLEKTDQAAKYVESILDTTKLVKFYATNIGHGNPRIYYNVVSLGYAKDFADVFVQLERFEYDEFNNLIDQLRNIFNKYPHAKINIKEFEQGVPITAPIMVYILGDDLEILRKIADDVESMLYKYDGPININNRLAKRRTDIFFNINRDKAAMYGVPLHEIDGSIRTAINGTTVSKFRDQHGDEYDIVLRLPVDKEIKLEDFDKIYVKSLTGKFIPIRQLANIEFKTVPGIINRYNLSRTGLVTADVGKGVKLDDIMKPLLQELESYSFPKNYTYYIGGELESRDETFGGMFTAIIIAIVSIFSVLVLQFRSFTQPLIIFIAIPFAAIGMIWALLITGNTFSFTAFVGFISLVGIVINNSIILVDYTNNLIKGGMNIFEALKKAGETRFTPIILTTLTTIGGLLPLTLRGGTLWAPMGWTIIGGLLVSTILTLIVVPVLYSVFSKDTLATIKEQAISIKDKYN